MGKPALVSQASRIDEILKGARTYPDGAVIPDSAQMASIYNLPAKIADRDWCEKDLSLLQYLPYIRLSYVKPNPTEPNWVDQYVFLYQRGKKGGEKNLLDKWSVGLGGHVEGTPTIEHPLLEVLVDCAQGELYEEIELLLKREVFRDALLHPVLIRDKREPTEAVHLGMLIDIRIEESMISGQHEAGVIDKGKWVLLRDLQERNRNGTIDLEPWSKVFVSIPLPAHPLVGILETA